MGRGTHRGFITYEELSKSLGKRNLSDENLAQAFIHILDENISLVEKKSDFKVLRKKENSNKEEGKTIEKSDDPIRMYLREMGGVELLSREGEIAIAKRIEAGKDVMLIALSQSPITAQQFFEWNEKLQKDEILVREIIDIDTNYMEDESTGPSAKQKNAGETDKDAREAIRYLAENNDTVIVASLGVFSTGINIRNLHNLVFAHPSKSKIKVLQSIGRVLRKADNGEKATVFDIVDDLKHGSRENFALRHASERFKFYVDESFDFKISKIELGDVRKIILLTRYFSLEKV